MVLSCFSTTRLPRGATRCNVQDGANLRRANAMVANRNEVAVLTGSTASWPTKSIRLYSVSFG